MLLAAALTGLRTERLSSAALLAGAGLIALSLALRLLLRRRRVAHALLGLGLLAGLGRLEPVALYVVLEAFLLRRRGADPRPLGRRDVAWAIGATLAAGLLAGAAIPCWPHHPGPRGPRPPEPWESATPFVIAHRGAHLTVPENSVASIVEAARLGARMAEIDIVDSLDGVLVVIHDRKVDRTTNGTGEVRKLTFEALRKLRLKGPDGKLTDEKIPTLDEMLEAARGRIVLYLDSRDAPVAALAGALGKCDPADILVYHDRWRWLTAFHALAPAIPLVPEAPFRRTIRIAADELDAFAFASSFKRFEASDGRVAHELGGRILVDVLDAGSGDAPVLEALARGADGIQTNDPAHVVALLARLPRK
jgi:glycerophosphoryl diester phosphodiesterase